jgi:hypothetical protein
MCTWVSLLCVLLTSCADANLISSADRAKIDETETGSLRFLNQSMYAGQFYDDDRYRLLHPRRFEELTYLLNAEGEPIPPPPPDEVIPVGTRVRIERIEWPSEDVIFRRPIYTPRFTTWVFLRVARERGSEGTIERNERHILLLPGGITDEATLTMWLDAALSEKDPNAWLLQLPDAQRAGVLEKRAVAGMDYRTVVAAMGLPNRLKRDIKDGHTVEVASYGSTSVQFVDGVVTSPPQTDTR